MSLLTFLAILQLLATFTDYADSKTQDYVSSSDGKLPSKCERYAGQLCSKIVGNQFVYVKPLQAQAQKEMQLQMLFRVLPGYISKQCQPYAFQALCLSAFPLCDLTVSYPKPRFFCQDECRVLEEYICVHEFNIGRAKPMTSFVPPCSKLPSVNSPEHKKCVRLNLTIAKPEFTLQLKNKTVYDGDTVVLRCKLKMTDIPPTITWYKDSTGIQPGHAFYKIHLFRHSARMKIRHIAVQDSGKYTCHVSNFITNVSTHSWVTVLPRPTSIMITTETNNKSSCGYLSPSAICGTYLQGEKVYFHDANKQHEHELLIQNALKQSNVSGNCSQAATAALCYHMFPSCGKKKIMKHRLCKEDCLKVKKTVCNNNHLPDIYPACFKLPKRSGRRGRHCDELKMEPEPDKPFFGPKMCGKYQGNNFCGKYLQNSTIFFHNMDTQYNLERIISNLKAISISEKCSKYGFPAMCYHLFPVCSHKERRSLLCRGECIKLKTDICRHEVSMIKTFSEKHLKALFPECPELPLEGTEEGSHCVKLGIPILKTTKEPDPTEKPALYDSSQTCYNDSGLNYLGTANVTVFGTTCISWGVRRPSTGWNHNFCRNPNGNAVSPWCYVNKDGRREYCDINKCEDLTAAPYTSGSESTSLGRTIYVVIAIVAVILLGCITVLVYWKVQNSKENVDNSPQNSAAPFAKCSSTQLTDVRENSSMQSFVLNEKLTRGRVKYVSVVSEGKFCKVFKGVLVNDHGKPNMNIVIKTLSEDASPIEKDRFRRETSLLCPLQHINILGLLGISPGDGSEFLVFEYLSEINLHQFLKRSSLQNNDLSMKVLLNITNQIANGMKYLYEFTYVHGDLAARNCFITEEAELTVKVSMLGIGSHQYPSDYGWLHQGETLFPIRWMSPEALDSLVLTTENDVWAFGVLLWEIFSYGQRPYQQYSNAEVTDKVRALELLQYPANCTSQTIKNLMKDCWTVAPSSRPNFVGIYDILNRELDNVCGHVTDDVITEVQV